MKSQITTSAVETDNLTFARVAAGQVCKTPLIPSASPTRQSRWTVNIEREAIYNPDKRTGLFADKVKIGYAARINGSVYGRRYVELETGMADTGSGLINGGVMSSGEVQMLEPKARGPDYRPAPMVVNGPVMGRTISISGEATIKGPLIASDDITISGSATVHGFVQSIHGTVKADRLFSWGLIAGNQLIPTKELSRRGPGVSLGRMVTLLTPTIWVKNEYGGVSMPHPVRILSGPCTSCTDGDILMCQAFADGKCARREQIRALTHADLEKSSDGLLIHDSWRSLRIDHARVQPVSDWISSNIQVFKNFGSVEKMFREEERARYATIEDLSPHIDQEIMSITQQITNISNETVMGDRVGAKVDIRDSVLSRTNLLVEAGQGPGTPQGRYDPFDGPPIKTPADLSPGDGPFPASPARAQKK